MSRTYKHQATYNYLHGNKTVKGSMLQGVKRYFDRINFPKGDYSLGYYGLNTNKETKSRNNKL